MASPQAEAAGQQLSATCHCKAIRLLFPPLREPVNECLCNVCRRYGALWAYYQPEEVTVQGAEALEEYVQNKRTLSFKRCKHCGCMTHYTVVPGADTKPRIAVNCRMMEKEPYMKLERKQSDGD